MENFNFIQKKGFFSVKFNFTKFKNKKNLSNQNIYLENRPCNFRDLNSLGDILLKYNEGHSIRPHIGMFHSYIGHEGCNEDHNLVPRIYGLANRFRKHKPYPRIWNTNEGPILDFFLFYNFTLFMYSKKKIT